ncbi:MAG: Dabb family protein [Opitutae bacterium]|nr:Dabb family protein [Opitutae bacterium]
MPQSFASPPSDIIRHVVCFKFKKDAKESEIKRVEKEFVSLKEKISGIESLEWGTNNSPENLNKDFTHCFIVTFANAKAREIYLPHPEHQAFVSFHIISRDQNTSCHWKQYGSAAKS